MSIKIPYMYSSSLIEVVTTDIWHVVWTIKIIKKYEEYCHK